MLVSLVVTAICALLLTSSRGVDGITGKQRLSNEGIDH
jgi:hypothetical protein